MLTFSACCRPNLLLYLLPTVCATIDVYITGSFHTNFTTRTSGTDKAIVTETERISFKISDGKIKDCVKTLLGGRPDDAFMHGPTPWGDLYKVHGWAETKRVLKPVSSRVINVASSPQMLKQILETNKTTISLSQTIYNRFSTTWLTAPNLSVNIIYAHIDVDNFVISYESALGVNGVMLKGMTTGIFLTDTLDFGSAIVELYATRVSVKTEVLYQASLWGNAVLNYEKAFGGHHFYSPNVEDIMFNCGLSNSLQVKEIIDVRFYVDAKVVVRNNSNGLIIMTRNVDINPL